MDFNVAIHGCGAQQYVLVIFRLIRDQVTGQQTQQRHPDVPLPRHLLQLFWGEPKAFPGQPRDIVPPACPGTPPEEGVQKTSGIDARATSTGPSRCGGAAALLRAPHPISKGVPGHPTEEAHFSRLYPGSHDPKFMPIGEGRNVDRPVNRELRLLVIYVIKKMFKS
ncbi:hypothetical protein GOODEAATRI_010861 [Goodea atripinnis]|uniref:Uncharacterized protein n=1 Tax=Goodea atripinnis TaxID=208336 RepID=A0ABV0NJ81_9TELE